MYGPYPLQAYPSRDGDRYILNGPTAGGVASYVKASGAWAVETYAEVSGTATVTGVGFTGSPTATVTYKISNGRVFLYLPSNGINGTSNSNSFSITGLPVAIRPTTNHTLGLVSAYDNGATVLASVQVSTTGTITLGKSLLGGAWTVSGTKGLYSTDFTYSLD